MIYELHTKGFTQRHPAIPPELRGRYEALGHPAAIEHLKMLGITAVELLPIHHSVTNGILAGKGLSNYWGYDTLGYFARDPVHRPYHHDELTFTMLYEHSECFINPLSHDEVVHGKRALLDKMPGDTWQRFANLRALYGYMYGHPGKKMLFMGVEFGQWWEWSHDDSLQWHLCQYEPHRGLQWYVRDLNRLHRNEPALHQADFDWTGFQWIDYSDGDQSVIAFIRKARDPAELVVCVCNFTPVPRHGYRIGVPAPGWYRELLNSDAAIYGGSNVGNWGGAQADPTPWHGLPYSVSLTLPPLAVLFLKPS